MHQLGILQGRLTPVTDGRIQAYPGERWRDDLEAAAGLGFDLVEWVLDYETAGDNALLSAGGRQDLREAAARYGIAVPIVCVDYFMQAPLTAADSTTRAEAGEMLEELVNVAPQAGIRQLDIPLIGNSSIESPAAEKELVTLLQRLFEAHPQDDVALLFETDLSPERAGDFIRQLPARCGINYDTGNSAYWSFDPEAEIRCYGARIMNVHIKDCTPADYSVPLGEGNADFDLTFKLLADIGYDGNFVLQTVRQADDVQAAKDFAAFTRACINRYLTA